MNVHRKLASGFTLIETLVALSLITAALTGPFTLAIRAIATTRAAKDRVVATNLGLEGVEIIRSFRDNNILAGRVWDQNIGGAASTETNWQGDIVCTATPCYPDGARTPNFSQCTGSCPFLNYDSVSGLYTHTGGAGVSSQFRRTITIDRRSDSEGNSWYDTDPSIGQANQMTVTVSVDWTFGGIPRQVQLTSILYNH